MDAKHPVLVTLAPILEKTGGRFVPAHEALADDIPVVWEGKTLACVRFGAPEPDTLGGLEKLLEEVAGELGGPLTALPRADKQRAVRLLEERGAFTFRKSAETVAAALGVTRFTVYNYLNRERA
ncbi:helix-turn-helix domain-containing protein [Nocardia seriolae]|uniref:helix-turn-helix domain-containing protein n=1 Tax=Nocardia seriolae TaxID=37332 RepID=UPI001BA45913|nr:helix-turn-helix domain-containing protein [Nocardia seriolae]QUN15282.1 helix-turn-helix domain-containing protein [Nocardia seriolae]WNJ57712.1 helix-turn-helix domain-containing protein [Nocardia seriolae]